VLEKQAAPSFSPVKCSPIVPAVVSPQDSVECSPVAAVVVSALDSDLRYLKELVYSF
jgi:anaerobic C4-dicarboxylate transporter